MLGKIPFGKRKAPVARAGDGSGTTPKWPPTEAELRAHIARHMPVVAPPGPDSPPSWRAQLQMITDAKREAVMMMPVVPSNRSDAPTSFIGGAPYVSGDFAWPRAIPYRNSNLKPHERPPPVRASESRSFVAQIDCSQLPGFEGKHLLPQHGRLCFFFDWMIMENHAPYEHPHAGAVVWDNGDGPLLEAALPPDLPPCHGDLSAQYYKWIPTAEPQLYPRTFDKFALEFRTINTYPDETYLDPSGASQPVYRAIVRRLMREQLRRIVSNPPTEPEIVFRPGLPRPSTTFPECWIHILIIARLFAGDIEQSVSRASPELRDEYVATLEDLLRVAAEAAIKPPFETLTADERAQFYSWYESLVAARRDGIGDVRTSTYLTGHLRSAYHLVADMMASQEADVASLLDADGINTVRLNRSPYYIRRDGQSEPGRRHQMFGHGANVHAAAQQFRSSHVMLAQFSSDRNGPFMWGDAGVLQYWIDTKALAGRDFSRVMVTVEST
jgi:hypothetical protein